VSPIITASGAGKAQFAERHADKARMGFAVIDVITTGRRADEFIGIEQRELMF